MSGPDLPPQEQLGLFPEPSGPDGHAPLPFGATASDSVRPAPVSLAIAQLARALPSQIRMGTSSWSFPGWAGLVYGRVASERRLARLGLEAYAHHPLLRAVGVDRGYYEPVAREQWRAYRSQVPADFRFVIKAHRDCVTPWSHEARGRQRNPRFLDATYTREHVVGPIVDELADQVGAILFQFPPLQPRGPHAAARFAVLLHRFLSQLPSGVIYAVELRNPELLTPEYGQVLRDSGAVHCYSHHPRMAPLEDQIRVVPPSDGNATVLRWMLGHELEYEEARILYRPFDRLVDEDPDTRARFGGLLRSAARADRPAFLIVNNKAEGSAPRSVFRMAEWLATRPQ